MKILVISAAFPPIRAAEADYAWHLCSGLRERGIEVELVTSAAAPPTELSGVRRWTSRSWGWTALPGLVWRLWRSRPDAVLLLYLGWLYDGHPMVTFLPAVVGRLLKNTPFLTIFFNRYGADRARHSVLTRFLQRAAEITVGHSSVLYEYGTLLTHSDRNFALGHPHAEVLNRVYPEGAAKLEVLPALPLIAQAKLGRAQARERRRKELRIGADEPLLGFLGYVYPGKGLETLVQALGRLPGKPKLCLIGGTLEPGSGEHRYPALLAQQIEAQGLSSQVIWTGPYDWRSECAAEYLWAVDAVVLPFDVGISLNNSSVASVASQQVAIVSTRGAQLEAPFHHGENVWLTAPKDPAALAEGIERVLSDTALRRKLEKGAGQLAREQFSWERALDRLTATATSLQHSASVRK